jgi:LacI family transcriptional regulator
VRHRQTSTYKDIQRLTGLSLATISKHFNGGGVLPKNRAAIEGAAVDLGYRPNPFARSLRRGDSQTVGVLLPSLQSAFIFSVIVEVERCLRAQGIGILVASSGGTDRTSSSPALDLLLSRRVDGIIAVPSPADVPALSEASRAGIPVVSLDWWHPDLATDSVTLDNFDAGRLAARHLIDHGHRNVAAVVDDLVSSMRERLDGFAAGVATAGIDLDPTNIARVRLSVADAYDATRALLARVDRPTAFFTTNYDVTLGAVIAINESGLRLGRDISLLGFDATDLALATRPTLTIIVQPVEELATETARLMTDHLNDPGSRHDPVVRRLPGRLVPGGSIGDAYR